MAAGPVPGARMAADTDKFSVLSAAQRVWAVGAIHGAVDQLRAVLAELERRIVPGDKLVFLGNFLGYGPGIIQVQNEMLLLRRSILARRGMFAADVAFLRGAQEEMWRKLLQLHIAPNPIEVLDWMLRQGMTQTLGSYGISAAAGQAACREGALAMAQWTTSIQTAMRTHPGHDELQLALRRAAYTADGALLFVAAGIDPQRPVSQQGDTFWWGSGYFSEIEAKYDGYNRVVRGFGRSHKGPEMDGYAVTLDGGCGFGGSLTAACFATDGTIADAIQA